MVAEDMWFKLTEVELILAPQLKWPADRDFIGSESFVLLASATGDGHLVVDGRFFPLRSGLVCICRPGQLIEIGLNGGDVKGLYVMRFMAVQPSEAGMPAASAEHTPFADDELCCMRELPPSVVVPLCVTMHRRWQQRHPSDRLRCEAGLLDLLGMAMDSRENRTEQVIEEAKALLDTQFREEITVDRLAETAGLSRFHFMRLFKLKFGKGV
ncbi:MAG: btr 2, partial [Paenibacillus sp.]|nr:btr 2 [Paenibacillus sp.]